MRTVWLVALLLIPTATAWDDAKDDYEVGIRAATVDGADEMVWTDGSTTGWYPFADVVSATIDESQNDMTFTVEYNDATANPGAPSDFFWIYYQFQFTLRGHDMVAIFRLPAHPDFDFGSPLLFLGVTGDDGGYLYFEEVTFLTRAEETANGITGTIPKAYFRDPNFVPLRQGDVLEDISFTVFDDAFGFGTIPILGCPHVYTQPQPFVSPGMCNVRVRDQIDDTIGDVTVELMPEGVGHILAHSDRPWRYTNGLATTFLFEVDIHNFDDEKDTVLLSAVNVPPGWEVLHPSKVEFATSGMETIPVAVTVPFVHTHGEELYMQLQAASEKDPAAETGVFLGLFFPDPPQPGGHHDTLYFHARDSDFFDPWLNTHKGLQDEDDAEWHNIRPSSTPLIQQAGWRFGTSTHWEWDIALRPGLQLGLDFDLSKPVEANLDLMLAQSIPSDVSAGLWLNSYDGEDQLLATLDPVSVDFQANQQQEVELQGIPEAVADRVERGNQNLYFRILIEPHDTPENQALMEPGPLATLHFGKSQLKLPLIDFHEQVDLSGLKLNTFSISGNHTYKHVNAGNTSVWLFNVTNHLSDQQTLDWTITGAHADWGQVSSHTVVPGGGQGQLVVQVTPPKGTAEGETAELLVMGTSRNDADRQVFVRVTAYVVDYAVPDESDLAKEATHEVATQNKALSKDSPGFNVIALLALLAAVVLMLRRR